MSAPEGDLDLDVKSFFVGALPSEWVVLPPASSAEAQALVDAAGLGGAPSGLGLMALRLRGEAESGSVRGALHVDGVAAAGGGASFGPSTGVGRGAPELVDLSWATENGVSPDLSVRVDRLYASGERGALRATLGRQAVSFGTGVVFTPMDVVAPFGAATLDTEHRPGVDALRVEGFAGTSGTASAVLAWVGDGVAIDGVAVDDLLGIGTARATVGLTDLVALGGIARGDGVAGLGVATSVGAVGVHGEATWTQPPDDGVGFLRVVAGVDGRPSGKTGVGVEAYAQTWGTSDPTEYLERMADARVARGELWTVGHAYAALTLSQELTPLVSASASAIGNLLDPSALLAPALSVSAGDDAAFSLGGFVPLGARPERITPPIDAASGLPLVDLVALADSVRSEFGLYPVAAFAALRAWL